MPKRIVKYRRPKVKYRSKAYRIYMRMRLGYDLAHALSLQRGREGFMRRIVGCPPPQPPIKQAHVQALTYSRHRHVYEDEITHPPKLSKK